MCVEFKSKYILYIYLIMISLWNYSFVRSGMKYRQTDVCIGILSIWPYDSFITYEVYFTNGTLAAKIILSKREVMKLEKKIYKSRCLLLLYARMTRRSNSKRHFSGPSPPSDTIRRRLLLFYFLLKLFTIYTAQ